MKILMLATDIYTHGGIARHTSSLASAFGELLDGDNVHVLALLKTGDSKDAPCGFRVLHTVSDTCSLTAKAAFAVRAACLGKEGYSLVVCSHAALAPIAAFVHKCFGIPYWIVCHGHEVWCRLPMFQRRALRNAELLLPVSHYTARQMAEANRFDGTKIRVVYNAVSKKLLIALLAAHLRQSEATNHALVTMPTTLLSVGSLSPDLSYKGFDTMIEALPAIREQVHNAKYVIVGAGSDRERLEQLSSRNGMASHVKFRGEISDEKLAEEYAACDVFVLPSRGSLETSSQGEGFGRVYVEAALAGKPVIGSTEGGAAEAVLPGKTGFLVNPSSRQALVENICTLLQNPELARQMGNAGHLWAVQNFTFASLRRSLAELLVMSGYNKASLPDNFGDQDRPDVANFQDSLSTSPR